MTLIRKEMRKDSGNLYEYSLYVNKSPRVASFGLCLYSIKIRLTLENGSVSEKIVKDIFSEGKRAVSFFDFILKNLVTPIDLPYVIEDALIF